MAYSSINVNLFDCSDGYGIYYNPNTNQISTSWTWGGLGYSIADGYTARAIAFKGA